MGNPVPFAHDASAWRPGRTLYGREGGAWRRIVRGYAFDGADWRLVHSDWELLPGYSHTPWRGCIHGGQLHVLSLENANVIHAWTGSSWSLLGNFGGTLVAGHLTSFDGKLWVLINNTAGAIYHWDGSAWSSAIVVTYAFNRSNLLVGPDGVLYLGAIYTGNCEYFDGTRFRQSAGHFGGSLTIHAGKIYCTSPGSAGATTYEWATSSQASIGNSAPDGNPRRLVSFGGNLYRTSAALNGLRRWGGGTSWPVESVGACDAAAAHGGALYLGHNTADAQALAPDLTRRWVGFPLGFVYDLVSDGAGTLYALTATGVWKRTC